MRHSSLTAFPLLCISINLVNIWWFMRRTMRQHFVEGHTHTRTPCAHTHSCSLPTVLFREICKSVLQLDLKNTAYTPSPASGEHLKHLHTFPSMSQLFQLGHSQGQEQPEFSALNQARYHCFCCWLCDRLRAKRTILWSFFQINLALLSKEPSLCWTTCNEH